MANLRFEPTPHFMQKNNNKNNILYAALEVKYVIMRVSICGEDPLFEHIYYMMCLVVITHKSITWDRFHWNFILRIQIRHFFDLF